MLLRGFCVLAWVESKNEAAVRSAHAEMLLRSAILGVETGLLRLYVRHSLEGLITTEDSGIGTRWGEAV